MLPLNDTFQNKTSRSRIFNPTLRSYILVWPQFFEWMQWITFLPHPTSQVGILLLLSSWSLLVFCSIFCFAAVYHVTCCCLVAKLCPFLCSPRDCSMPGFPVLHCFRVCVNSCPLSQWFYLTISSSAAPFSCCPPSFPASGSFPKSQLLASCGQSIGASASVIVYCMHAETLTWSICR